jgi:heme/copper-type cytochrome/quinol oxidase subunit 1
MSQGPALSPHRPELVSHGVAPSRPRWLELATSSDHKDVGRILIGASLGFLVIGLVEFLLMRVQLLVPQNELIASVTFNRLLSVFAPTLLLLFALPLVMGLFTYLVPLQIGARSTAFPRLGSLGLWLLLTGGAVLYASFVYTPPESGTTGLPPLTDDIAFISNNGVDVWITAVGLSVLGLVLQAVNLVVTTRRMRAPGLAWRRMAPFSFAATVCSWLLVVVGPLMLAALTMLEIDRQFDGVFFEAGEGGAPLYYQHLAWLFFTGAYMVMLISAIGAISEILPTFSGKPLLSRGAVAASMVAIAVLGTLAWMQNMFSASIPIGWLYFAMAAALLLIVPLGLILLDWLATLFSGAIGLRAPMLFALAAISTLSFGLVGELAQSLIPVNWLLAGTTQATADTGYVLVGGPVLAGLAALHYWFPKLCGRTMGEGLARLSLVLILIGVHLTFIPMGLAGLEGQPVDVYRFYDVGDLDLWNALTTIGAFVLAAGIVVSVVNAAISVRGGIRAGPDPWHGETLEWFALSPPPPHNFDVVPDVRSAEPMRDIREAIAARPAEEVRPAPVAAGEPESESGEPVA